MPVHVSGTVTSIHSDRSHTEPTEPVDFGSVASEESRTKLIGAYTNTGDVAQTLTLAAPENLVGVTFGGYTFKNGELTETGSTITISPAGHADLYVTVIGETLERDAPSVDFTLDVPAGVWS